MYVLENRDAKYVSVKLAYVCMVNVGNVLWAVSLTPIKNGNRIAANFCGPIHSPSKLIHGDSFHGKHKRLEGLFGNDGAKPIIWE